MNMCGFSTISGKQKKGREGYIDILRKWDILLNFQQTKRSKLHIFKKTMIITSSNGTDMSVKNLFTHSMHIHQQNAHIQITFDDWKSAFNWFRVKSILKTIFILFSHLFNLSLSHYVNLKFFHRLFVDFSIGF